MPAIYTTITTDAGIKDNISAFAFYIRNDRHRVTQSGIFKQHTNNSTMAELWCIIKALTYAGNKKLLGKTTLLVVNTDSKSALEMINQGFTRPLYKDLKPHYDNAIAKLNVPISFRHVKGHHNNGQPRNKANIYCDKLIREYYKK